MFTQPTNWKNQTPLERLEYLQTLAAQVTARDGRPEALDVTHGGTQSSYDHDSRTIAINANFINHDEPFNAVESLFHESCHAQQRHIIDNPDLATSPEQLQRLQDNDVVYIQEKEDPFVYRMQTQEQQARQSARTDMEQMFGDRDNAAYAQHRTARDAHDAQWDADAIAHVNNLPQFKEFSGTAQDKVDQYIARQAKRKYHDIAASQAIQHASAISTLSGETVGEDHDQQVSYRRSRS